MPPWLKTYSTAILRFLGLASDSQRPNVGAFLFLGGLVFMSMRFTPDPSLDFFGNAELMLKAAGEMVSKADNLIGIAMLAIGAKQMQSAQPPTS